MSDHLKNLSQVYLEQIAESAVPGKPAEKLKTDRAGYSIPKAEQMAAAERIKKKTAEKKAALEKKHGKKMDDHPEYPNKKYVDEADMSGAPSIKDAKPAKKTKVKYDPHMKVMAPQVEKEEVEQVDENRAAMGRINKEYHRKKEADEMAARVRDPKVKRDLPKRKNDNPMYDAKSAGSSRVKDFKFTKEALDPVGKEDADVDNDGKKNDRNDKYIMKRREAIRKAIAAKKKSLNN